MMKTYEDKLKAEGRVTTGLFNCPECDGPPMPAFAIVERTPGRWTCSNCNLLDTMAVRQEEEAAVAAALPPWETEDANWIRAQRTLLQNEWRWSVMPDSPLTAEAQARCMEFLRLLNTLTLDYPSPEDVIWPVVPVLGSGDYDAQDA